MNISEKEQELLDFLATSNKIKTVEDIANNLYVSEPTVRRYLLSLSKKGYVIRTHGGAMINHETAYNKNIPLYMRITNMSEQKGIIAKKAVSLIHDGNVIFLDASSSAFHLLPFLNKFRDLIILTNSLKTSITLSEMNIKNICLGGEVNFSNLSCNSQETLNMIQKVNADLLFFSCDALSDDGLITDESTSTNVLREKMIANSNTKILLIDNTKLHKKCWNTLCTVKDIDYVACNVKLPDSVLIQLKNNQL